MDYSKQPICPGPCLRCGVLTGGRTGGFRWFCDGCLAPMRIVNRHPKSNVVRLPPSREQRELRPTG